MRIKQAPYLAAALAAALLLFVGVPLVADTPAEKAEHPEVEGEADCQTCHAEMTPGVVKQWFAGPHGKFNVKCFVCHGSTGEDFVREPSADRCVGCHADQVASLAAWPELQEKSCFSCHPSHALNPHAAAGESKGGGQ